MYIGWMSELLSQTQRWIDLDRKHVWHPFTPMKQWREQDQLVIEQAEGFELIDSDGNRYIDGVSSLWCNVHGHRVPEIDQAVRDQLDKVAHTTLLGLVSPPAAELAAELCRIAPGGEGSKFQTQPDKRLNKVFYSDAGATALEVAFKMSVGYWHHQGQPQRRKFIGLSGAYHGDTVGAMSVGYSDLFHKAFSTMVFDVSWFASPDACRPPAGVREALNSQSMDVCSNCLGNGHCGLQAFPSECPNYGQVLKDVCIADLDRLLTEIGDEVAAVTIEPVMQGAAGMVCQPDGFVGAVREMCDKHGVLMIADEVATGFGRTGEMFACEHDRVVPDLLCVAKGITGGYLPLAATMCTDAIDLAFTGELSDRRTLYHGHTYTGNPLASASALATIKLFEENQVLENARNLARIIESRLAGIIEHPHVMDIRQRGTMVGIELCQSRGDGSSMPEPFDFSARTGTELCLAMREQGVWVRPLGDVLVLMPAPAMDEATLNRMLDVVLQTLENFRWDGK